MGFNIKRYRETAELREVTCEFAGASFRFWYAPSSYTPKFFERLHTDIKGDLSVHAFVTMITHCVQRWEVIDEFPLLDANGTPVLGEDGQPLTEERMVPLDADHVSSLPVALLAAVTEAMAKDQSPNAETPKPTGSFASG